MKEKYSHAGITYSDTLPAFSCNKKAGYICTAVER